MSPEAARVLVVDDDAEMCRFLQTALGKRGFAATVSTSGDDAFARLDQEDFDVVLTDVAMRGLSGLDLCQRVVANRPDLPVVVMTAFGSLDTAIAAIRAGAYDFITKPVELEALRIALDRAVQHRLLRAELRRLRDVVAGGGGHDGITGKSVEMRRVFEIVDRVAGTDATVLITGESGTGKELVARALHQRSRRAKGPFVAINCAAMPEALLESELFGHAKGAFTDARHARAGLFGQASGGTLFLDEIGDMPLGMQAKLLRALQDRKIRPLGGDHEVAFDARLVAATNRDHETAVEEKRFREDLFYRLNVIHVPLPPLRGRGGDVLLIAQELVLKFAASFGKDIRGFTAEAAQRLVGYSWPGNVRELSNCIERAVALARFEELTVEDLPDKIRAYQPSHVVVASDDPSEVVPLEEVERRYVLRALDALGGNRTLAAQKLGVDRKTLYRKLKARGAGGDDAD